MIQVLLVFFLLQSIFAVDLFDQENENHLFETGNNQQTDQFQNLNNEKVVGIFQKEHLIDYDKIERSNKRNLQTGSQSDISVPLLYEDVTKYDGSDLTSKMELSDPILANFDSSCSHHQILLNGTCIECSSLISGCRACKLTTNKFFLNYRNASIIECQTCDQGGYLLTFDDQKQFRVPLDQQKPYRLSICVRSCEDFGYNYVSNPNTMRCEYCGAQCTQCNLQYGCNKCIGNWGRQISSEFYYNRLVDKTQNTSIFPFSFNPYTPNNAPSSSFKVCIDCEQVDERCDSCQYHTKFSQINSLRTKVNWPNNTSGYKQYVCDSCPSYVQSKQDQRDYGGWCLLQESPILNCLQGDPKNINNCMFCQKDYYVNQQGLCSTCSDGVKRADGCKRCNISQCIECLEGFTMENGKCLRCDLSNSESQKYKFFKNRCTQCQNGATDKCSYCNQGFIDATNFTDQDKQKNFVNSSFDTTNQKIEVCRLKCESSQFPFINYTNRDSSPVQIFDFGKSCQNCDSSKCVRCAESNSTCTLCKIGQFLRLQEPFARGIGSCQDKRINNSVKFDIFVSNQLDESALPGQMRKGTFDDPFAQLTDAFTKANDFAAPFSNNVAINIWLYKGDHFLVENRQDAINIFRSNTTAFDQSITNLNITIRPLLCGQFSNDTNKCFFQSEIDQGAQITIYNKIRERLVFRFMAQLSIQNIIIDSLDSILQFGTPCLSQYTQCCQLINPSIDFHGVSNVDPNQSFDCGLEFQKLQLSDNCQVGQQQAMFQSYVSQQFQINQPPYITPMVTNNLNIQNSEIRNIFWQMNSLINLTSFGGRVFLKNSTFKQINICGAIIKNNFTLVNSQIFSQIDSSILQQSEIDFLQEQLNIKNNQQFFYDNYNLPLDSQKFTSQTSGIFYIFLQSGIYIDSSSFYFLNYQSQIIKEINKVDINSGMRHQAVVLQLDQFPGPVVIKNSTFLNNIFKYKDCFIKNDPMKQEVRFLDNSTNFLKNNFNFIYRQPSYTYDKVQIKSIITITNHYQQLVIFNNTFLNNTGLKGILNLERQLRDNSQGFVIVQNTFENNSALVDSNVLNLRTQLRTSQLLGQTYRNLTHLDCGGILLHGNQFVNNGGCNFTNGAAHIYCFDQNFSQNQSQVYYQPELDSQYFIGNLFNSSAYSQNISRIRSAQQSFMDSIGDQQNLSGLSRDDMNVDLNYFVMRKNYFSNNLAGANRSVLSVEGFPIVKSNYDNFLQNINWFQELFFNQTFIGQFQKNQISQDQANKAIDNSSTLNSSLLNSKNLNSSILNSTNSNKSILNSSIIDSSIINSSSINQSSINQSSTQITNSTNETLEYPIFENPPEDNKYIDSTFLQRYEQKSKSIFVIYRSLLIEFSGTTFDSNFIVDDVDPYDPNPIQQNNQSQGLLIIDFVGNLNLNQGTAFNNHKGILSSPKIMEFVSQSYVQLGFKNKLFALQRYQLANISVNGLKFVGNQAYNYSTGLPGQKTARPRLFNISKDDFYGNFSNSLLRLDGIEISNNTFYNADCMMHLEAYNLTYNNFIIRNNGLEQNNSDSPRENIICLDFYKSMNISLNGWNVTSNKMGDGKIIHLNMLEGDVNESSPQVSNIKIDKNSFFVNNTGTHKGVILVLEDLPWLFLSIQNSSIGNNFASVVNDIYLRNIARFDFIQSYWFQQPEPNELPINPRTPNRAKFIVMEDDKAFEMNVEGSIFDCMMPFDRNIVFTMNQQLERGEPPVFRYSVPFNQQFFSSKDQGLNTTYKLPKSSQSSFISCVINNDNYEDPNRNYICTRQLFLWQFTNKNKFQNCNQAEKGAIFLLSNGTKVNITGLTNQANNNSALRGGFAYLTDNNTEIMFQSNRFNDSGQLNAQNAYFGGAFFLTNFANLTLINTTLQKSENYQGSIYLEMSTFANLQNLTLKENLIHDRGLIFCQKNSHFMLENSEFINNEGVYDSAIIYIDGPRFRRYFSGNSDDNYVMNSFEIFEEFRSSLKNVTINGTRMKYGGNLISVINSNLSISNSYFWNNNVTSVHGGIYLAFSHLDLVETTFDKVFDFQFYNNATVPWISRDLKGAYVFVTENSSFVSQGNKYYNGRAKQGGCVAVQGLSTASFQKDRFEKCVGIIGGGVFASDTSFIEISDSYFINNSAISGQGENIYASRIGNQLIIKYTDFYSYMNSIYLEEVNDLQVSNTNLYYIGNDTVKGEIAGRTPLPDTSVIDRDKELNQEDKKKQKDALRNAQISRLVLRTLKGGGFYILNPFIISLFDTVTINNLRADQGAGIYIELQENFKKQQFNSQQFVFNNLIIQSCESFQAGGGLYILNIQDLFIDNSTISNNYAYNGEGGGINYICEKNQWNVFQKCGLIFGKVNIQENVADVGGGIKWNYKPTFSEQTIVNNNQAKIYGINNASFPVKLVTFITRQDGSSTDIIGQRDQDYYNNFINQSTALQPFNSTMANHSIILPMTGIQSGGPIHKRYLALIDEYNQTVVTNKGSRLTVTKSDNKTNIDGLQIFFSAYGLFAVQNMIIYTTPNTNNIYLNYTVDQNGVETDGTFNYTVRFDLQVDKCQVGEAQLESRGNFICKKCDDGTYLLKAPEVGKVTPCNPCQEQKSQCLGGSKIGPKPGYWRKNETTNFFIPCMVEEACLGLYKQKPGSADEQQYLATGWCAENYYGALCSSCVPGAQSYDKYNCEKCGPTWKNLLQIFGIIIAFAIAISMLVKSTIAAASKPVVHGVFIKILLNHMQMIFIVSNFDMKWPPFIATLFQQLAVLVQIQKMAIAFDCEMDIRTPDFDLTSFEAGQNEWRITYLKLIIYSFIPIFFCMVCWVVWWIIFKFEQDVQPGQLYQRFLSTYVILLFIMHPQVTQYMMNMFNCSDFDGDSRLIVDLQIICWVNLHETLAYSIGLICLVIWGIGIPAIIFSLMFKEKENLDTDAIKIQYGFLYNGFKRENYYWEIVIMYRKIICLSIAVMIKSFGNIVQALVLLVILVLFMLLNNSLRPFAIRALNEIEDLSIMTQILTIYCGLFFISTRDNTSPDFNPNTDYHMNLISQTILFIMITFVNIYFVIQWIIRFIGTIKVMIKDNYKDIYIAVFLCCRKDKLQKDDAKIATDAKRETIIEKIEDIQFFIKSMKEIYTKEIYYEGHDRFLNLLYFIENERQKINLTIKVNDLYVQGEIAKERKFDKERIKVAKEILNLSVDHQSGGKQLNMSRMKQIISPRSDSSNQGSDDRSNPLYKLIGSPFNEKNPEKNLQDLKKERIDFDDKDSLEMTQQSKFGLQNIVSNKYGSNKIQISPGFMGVESNSKSVKDLKKNLNKIDISMTQLGSIDLSKQVKKALNDNFQKQGKGKQKVEDKSGLTSSDGDVKSEKDIDDDSQLKNEKKKKKGGGIKIANKLNVVDVYVKSRNAKRRMNTEHKPRIFSKDLNNPNHAHTYMIQKFPPNYKDDYGEEQKDQDSYSDIDSPEKAEQDENEKKEINPTSFQQILDDEMLRDNKENESLAKLIKTEVISDSKNKSQSQSGDQKSELIKSQTKILENEDQQESKEDQEAQEIEEIKEQEEEQDEEKLQEKDETETEQFKEPQFYMIFDPSHGKLKIEKEEKMAKKKVNFQETQGEGELEDKSDSLQLSILDSKNQEQVEIEDKNEGAFDGSYSDNQSEKFEVDLKAIKISSKNKRPLSKHDRALYSPKDHNLGNSQDTNEKDQANQSVKMVEQFKRQHTDHNTSKTITAANYDKNFIKDHASTSKNITEKYKDISQNSNAFYDYQKKGTMLQDVKAHQDMLYTEVVDQETGLPEIQLLKKKKDAQDKVQKERAKNPFRNIY